MTTIGSLFSGAVDGLALGLQWAGAGELLWHCELDPWRRSCLERNWPRATSYVDVRDLAVHEITCCLDGDCTCAVAEQHAAILCGGFPCQDTSDTGHKRGIEHGERSGLWREFARVIRELRPGVVFVENVRGVPTPSHCAARGMNETAQAAGRRRRCASHP